MRVLKKGTDRKDLSKKVTCRKCGALLEVHPGDVVENGGRDISGVYDIDYVVYCPECGTCLNVGRWWLKY